MIIFERKLPIIRKRNPIVQRLAHYLVGLIIIVKGIEKADHFSGHPLVCLSLFFIGGFILFANFRHHLFEKHFKEFNVVLFLCEGIVLVIISIYYFSEGKKAIPYLYLITAIVYLVMAVRLYKKKSATEAADTKEESVQAMPEAEEIQVGK